MNNINIQVLSINQIQFVLKYNLKFVKYLKRRKSSELTVNLFPIILSSQNSYNFHNGRNRVKTVYLTVNLTILISKLRIIMLNMSLECNSFYITIKILLISEQLSLRICIIVINLLCNQHILFHKHVNAISYLRIPLQKIFTLIIRTFSKPMLSYMKSKQQKNQMKHFNIIFMAFGRFYYRMEQFVNHKILKTSQKRTITHLKDDIALEKGIESFYELIFYAILIGIPIWQLHKASVSSEKKQKNLQRKLSSMEQSLQKLHQKLENAGKNAQTI